MMRRGAAKPARTHAAEGAKRVTPPVLASQGAAAPATGDFRVLLLGAIGVMPLLCPDIIFAAVSVERAEYLLTGAVRT